MALAGLAALVGWLADIPGLTSLYLPGPTLKTNAAICLIAGGAASLLLLWTGRRSGRAVARGLAAVQATLGALTLVQHLAGWDLGIDQLLAVEGRGAEATMSPNRMGPPSSLANMLLGLALVAASTKSARTRGIATAPALVAGLIALLPIVGYSYGVSQFYDMARYTGISLINAIAIFSLAIAVESGRHESGITALLCRSDEIGVYARRLVPAAVLLPFASGWVLSRMIDDGLMDGSFAVSTMALLLIVLMAGVIWRTGRQLIASLDARTATELALSESERTLRQSDQQKTEFLATLSHELRNPLAPIRFAVELLEGSPTAAAQARQTIERQVRHLTRLIDDLLDLTRISRNRLELHPRACELDVLVNDAVDAVAGEIRRAGHRLELQLPSQPVWLQADPDRVIQMLVNLLTNASRYSDPGGTIEVGTRVEHSDVIVRVRDSGRGLAAADLERIFERFVQVGRSPHGGLGIGLALVRALAELHRGSIEAHSDGPGRGAEFRLRLPRAAAPVDVAAAAAPRRSQPRRVLVVDDNCDAADMLGALLRADGHRPLVAYSGDEALAAISSFGPEAALLDIGMSGMDGYQLAAQLRAGMPDLFLVAITGWGQEEDRRRALHAGFDAHLTKPADPQQITALLAARFCTPGSTPASTPEPHAVPPTRPSAV